MKVVQILPELNAGGVERGTLEVAAHLVREGHEAIVISNGGRQVPALEASGATHFTLPVHRKSLASLLQVRPLRRFLNEQRPDILHIRSRVPGWIAWLAWRGMDPATRPRLVSTVHGFYSVNRYSAVMTRGQRVIAVSESIRDYIQENYPATPSEIIRVIHRGVDTTILQPSYEAPAEWLEDWQQTYPQLKDRLLLLMPGRLTRWKGQQDFLHVIAKLLALGHPVHGLIAGEPHPKKIAFGDELRELATTLKVTDHVTFLGHRSDLREVMSVAALVFSLSRVPEAFGRVSLEAMALGKPVVGYDHGGVGEQLSAIFPVGKALAGDIDAAVCCSCEILRENHRPGSVDDFSLDKMLVSTLEVYQSVLASPR